MLQHLVHQRLAELRDLDGRIKRAQDKDEEEFRLGERQVSAIIVECPEKAGGDLFDRLTAETAWDSAADVVCSPEERPLAPPTAVGPS